MPNDLDNKIIRLQALAEYDGEDRVVRVDKYLEQASGNDALKVIKSGLSGLDKLVEGFHWGS